MKLMTFNILKGGIDEYGSRIDFIKEVIKEASPGFLALQEANNFEKDDNKLLREISQDIGLQYYALSAGSILEDGEQYHTASLSCYPLKKNYPFTGPSFQCAALFSLIDSPLGELAICNIHLNVNSEDERLKELEIILEYMAVYKNQILLGDFNSIALDDDYDPETLEVESRFDVTNILNRDYVDVASHLKLDNRSMCPTPSNRNPDYTKPIRIDYIFVSPTLAACIKAATVIKTPVSEQASDHYPLILTIE